MNLQGHFFSVLACGLLWSGAVAQETPSGLEGLRSQFETHSNLLRRPVTELGDQYEKALTGLRDDFQKKADLDGLLAVKQELERFAKDRSPAPESSKVEALARIQKVYEASHAAALAKLEDQVVAAKAAYRDQLEALMRKLTTEGNVDEAVKVRAALEQIGDGSDGKVTLETGLVLHFRFDPDQDEAVRDSSPANNHGRLMGDAKISTGGNRGRYLDLDGAGDFIEIPHNDSLTLTTEGSISLWVRPERLVATRGLVSKYTPKQSYTLRTWTKSDFRRLGFGDLKENAVSKAELPLKQWTHVAVTLDSGKVRFYFDGELDAEGERAGPLETNTNPVFIGNDYDGRYFTGAIDDVRIYRRALSADEVDTIFQTES